jgi:DNA-binding CsgD family transcriptional regulator
MPERKAGLVLLDRSGKVVAANRDARELLATTDRRARPHPNSLDDQIHGLIARIRSQGDSAVRFMSGGSWYACQWLPLFSIGDGESDGAPACSAVLLVASHPGHAAIDELAAKYDLTQREQETLNHLLAGLSTKEIADRMRISTSTVKAFVRLLTIKIGVNGRSQLLARILAMES